MTERESEELFQELRRKLADYGSQPSEEVWQGIRQQLPPLPPVPSVGSQPARPILRVKKRRLLAVTLLLLIGLVATLGVLLPYQPATLTQTAADSTVPPPQLAGKVSATPQPEAHASTPLVSSASPTAIARHSGESAGALASRSMGAAAPDYSSATAATSRATIGSGTTIKPNSTFSRKRQPPFLSATSAAARHPVLVPQQAGARSSATAAVAASPKSAAASVAARSANTSAIYSGATSPAVATATASAANSAPDGATASGRTATTGSAAAAAAARERLVDETGSTAPEVAALRPLAYQLPKSYTPELLSPAAGIYITPSSQLPQQLPLLTLPPPDSAARQPSRWALEVLAGPTISYRRLGRSDLAAGISRYERPAAAFAAQAQLRYALTPSLQVSAGLGYTEYSTRLNLLIRPLRPDSASTNSGSQAVQQRDVYRFFTVPVQVQYQLGSRSRLRYGLTGGATLNLYAGGRTSGSSACTCAQQQTWAATSADSPYRQLGLGVTGGMDVRYALTPRLTLLVQPTVRYSLLSISADNTAWPARYPFAAGLLTGVSFDLR